MDKIEIKGLRLMACHGCLPEEQTTPQPFVLDVSLYRDLTRAGKTDALEDTVNYAEVVERITRTVCDVTCRLIERVASRVAEMLLKEYPLEIVTVRVHKPQAPVDADFSDISVEITRVRGEYK